MNNITFGEKIIVIVKLENKIIGEIRKDKDRMFRYWPKSKGRKISGDPYPSVFSCKKSLLGD
jgi:hypothetical protein